MIKESDFESMNETDVRELIVRPLIQQLGYAPGQQHNVRSEVPLRYNKQVLGHRKPKTDHVMAGRADYVCDVVSYGRWTVEVKAPHIGISEQTREQAHSYASHPEIAASHFLVTNGRTFHVYSLLEPRSPVLEWTHDNQSKMWVNICNLLGPDQIRTRRMGEQQNRGKALASGLGSSAQIVGGRLEYGAYESSDLPHAAALQALTGLRATVEGELVTRDESGRICVRLKVAGPTAQWDEINKLAGVEAFDFFTSDEYLSVLEETPTVLQGLQLFHLPAGVSLKGFPGVPNNVDRLPFPLAMSAFTQATGYLRGNTMQGVFLIEYTLSLPTQLVALGMPASFTFKNVGDFFVNVS